VELASPRFVYDYFDVALTLGGSSLGSCHDQYAGYDDDVLIEEFYSDHYSITTSKTPVSTLKGHFICSAAFSDFEARKIAASGFLRLG
jgi:hypothetical protein